MKVSLIEGYYFYNKGDVAITEGTIRTLKELKLGINIVSVFMPNSWKIFQDNYQFRLYNNFSEFLTLKKFSKGPLKKPKDYARKYIEYLREVGNSDLIWIIGGMHYGDVKNPKIRGTVTALNRIIAVSTMAKILREPLVVGGISLGGDIYKPYTGIAIKELTSSAISLILREPISYKLVIDYVKGHLKESKSRILLGYDYAFNCYPLYTHRAKKGINWIEKFVDVRGIDKLVLVNVMPKNPLSFIERMISSLLDYGYGVALYPHDLDDLIFAYKVKQNISKSKKNYSQRITILDTIPFLASELYYILSHLNKKKIVAFGISYRSHGAIAFLTNKIPTLHIAYSHKGVGIMKMLGLGKYCVKTKEVTRDALIVRLIDRLIKERDFYEEYLESLIPRARRHILLQTKEAIPQFLI